MQPRFQFVNELFNAFTYIYFCHYLKRPLDKSLVDGYSLTDLNNLQTLRKFTDQFARLRLDAGFEEPTIKKFFDYIRALRDDEDTRMIFLEEKRWYGLGNSMTADEIAVSVRYFLERLVTNNKIFMEELFVGQPNILEPEYLVRLLYLSDSSVKDNDIVFKLDYSATAKDLGIEESILKETIKNILSQNNGLKLVHDVSQGELTLLNAGAIIVLPRDRYNVTQAVKHCLEMLDRNNKEYQMTSAALTLPLYEPKGVGNLTYFQPANKDVLATPLSATNAYAAYFATLLGDRRRVHLYQKTRRQCGLTIYDQVYIPLPGFKQADMKAITEHVYEYIRDKFHLSGHLGFSPDGKKIPQICMVPDVLSETMSGIILSIAWIPVAHNPFDGLNVKEFDQFLVNLLKFRRPSIHISMDAAAVTCHGAFTESFEGDPTRDGAAGRFDLRPLEGMNQVRGTNTYSRTQLFLFGGCDKTTKDKQLFTKVDMKPQGAQVEIFQLHIKRPEGPR